MLHFYGVFFFQLETCKEFRQNMMMKNFDKILEGKKKKKMLLESLATVHGDR